MTGAPVRHKTMKNGGRSHGRARAAGPAVGLLTGRLSRCQVDNAINESARKAMRARLYRLIRYGVARTP